MEHGYFIFAAHFPAIQDVEKEKRRREDAREKNEILHLQVTACSHENRNWALCENMRGRNWVRTTERTTANCFTWHPSLGRRNWYGSL